MLAAAVRRRAASKKMSASSPSEQQPSLQQQQHPRRRQQQQQQLMQQPPQQSSSAATAAAAEHGGSAQTATSLAAAFPSAESAADAAEDLGMQRSFSSEAAAARKRGDRSLSLPHTSPHSRFSRPPSDRHPYCVVWTYLPCITTLLPVVGHVGICTSDGIVHDFAGSYFISIDDMAFHKPLKVWRLNPELVNRPGGPQAFDAAIEEADEEFRRSAHNLFTNNCHHHVAEALNRMRYAGKDNWTPWDIFWNLTTKGEYLSWGDWALVWGLLTTLLVLGLLCCTVLPFLPFP